MKYASYIVVNEHGDAVTGFYYGRKEAHEAAAKYLNDEAPKSTLHIMRSVGAISLQPSYFQTDEDAPQADNPRAG